MRKRIVRERSGGGTNVSFLNIFAIPFASLTSMGLMLAA
jgi:hypothetical protein